MFRIPDTALGFAVEVVASLLLSYALVSFVEHVIHRNLMHRHKLPKLVYKLVPHLHIVHSDHAVEHHGRFYKEFDWEPDPEGREVNLAIRVQDTAFLGIGQLPIFIGAALFSPILCASYALVGATHNLVWSKVHREMHIPDDKNGFKRWRAYRFLARHHFMHHVHPTTNLNVVFPFADWILGTVSKPRQRDVREMLRMGYLLPRSDRAKRCLESIRARVAAERSAFEQGVHVESVAA